MKYLEIRVPQFSHIQITAINSGIIIKTHKQTNKIPDKTTAYLPSIFRIHTSSSSKNISGPSRFSMSLKPLQGTYEEDTHKEGSVTSNNVVVTLTHKCELQTKLLISMEVVTPLPHYLAPPTH